MRLKLSALASVFFLSFCYLLRSGNAESGPVKGTGTALIAIPLWHQGSRGRRSSHTPISDEPIQFPAEHHPTEQFPAKLPDSFRWISESADSDIIISKPDPAEAPTLAEWQDALKNLADNISKLSLSVTSLDEQEDGGNIESFFSSNNTEEPGSTEEAAGEEAAEGKVEQLNPAESLLSITTESGQFCYRLRQEGEMNGESIAGSSVTAGTEGVVVEQVSCSGDTTVDSDGLVYGYRKVDYCFRTHLSPLAPNRQISNHLTNSHEQENPSPKNENVKMVKAREVECTTSTVNDQDVEEPMVLDSFPLESPMECTQESNDTQKLAYADMFRAGNKSSANQQMESAFGNTQDGTRVNGGIEERSLAVSTTKSSVGGALPGATGSNVLDYGTSSDGNETLSKEETRRNVRRVLKEADVDTILKSQRKSKIPTTGAGNNYQFIGQNKKQDPGETLPSSLVKKSHRGLPRKACIAYLNEQYQLDNNLLSQPRATKYLIKVRTEISPGRYMAKLDLHCSSQDDRLPNLDATRQVADTVNDKQKVADVRYRKHFPRNNDKQGYMLFSSNEKFSGTAQYPLPSKKAVASSIGRGGNAIVFSLFYEGKEFAVKKTVYRSKEISVHSKLEHINIVNLEAVLIGEKHEIRKDKRYIYCFMPKMDINFRNVLSTGDHGCLKHIKMQLVEKRKQWETVLDNTKHVLKSVLNALDYMHSQGLVHRDIKASNILLKKICQCNDLLYCSCNSQNKPLVQIGDFDSSATVPGYNLQVEDHQMIRYASVLPLGTMGYRAPEVSMHLVLSGPYEELYTTKVDIWSYGCLLLTIFIGKSGPLKQRGEASLLLSTQDAPYSEELYLKIIKLNEINKYYVNTPGVFDLVQKCLQVQPHCRPTAKELLKLDFFSVPRSH